MYSLIIVVPFSTFSVSSGKEGKKCAYPQWLLQLCLQSWYSKNSNQLTPLFQSCAFTQMMKEIWREARNKSRQKHWMAIIQQGKRKTNTFAISMCRTHDGTYYITFSFGFDKIHSPLFLHWDHCILVVAVCDWILFEGPSSCSVIIKKAISFSLASLSLLMSVLL